MPNTETAKHKTRRNPRLEAKKRRTRSGEGKGRRASDVTAEIKSNANTKLHYPSHTLASLSPFSLHSFYTVLLRPLSLSLTLSLFPCLSHPRILSFICPSQLLTLSFLSTLFVGAFHRLPRRSLPFLEPPACRLRISPPNLTYPRGITPLPFARSLARAIWNGTGK